MKSSFSNRTNCVDVTLDPEGRVQVRNSRQLEPGRPCVAFTHAEWEAFELGMKNGEFSYERLPLAACQLPLASVPYPTV